MKLIPTFSTSGIAEMIRPTIIGNVFGDRLPRNFVSRQIGTTSQLVHSLLQ